MRGRRGGILKEVTTFSFCAVFTRGARDGALKNSLETQRERMQIDFMYAKSGALQRRHCITTINNARSVGAGIDNHVSKSSESMQISFQQKTDYILLSGSRSTNL